MSDREIRIEDEQVEERAVWSREFTDATGLFYAEVQVDSPDPPYPAMVRLDPIEPGSLIDYDAMALGQLLIDAAAEAVRRNRSPRCPTCGSDDPARHYQRGFKPRGAIDRCPSAFHEPMPAEGGSDE